MHDLLFALKIVASVLLGAAMLAYFIVAGFGYYLGTDRSRGLQPDDPVFAGRYAEAIPVLAYVPPDRAYGLAASALSRVGSARPEQWNANTIVGWYNNFGLWARWQLAIAILPQPDGRTCFLCCCRPRWSRAILDMGVSLNRARKLAEMVDQLANQPIVVPPPPRGWQELQVS